MQGFTAMQFLLTHPVWDVTYFVGDAIEKILISTHTSRVGCDEGWARDGCTDKISTHTSRVGCDKAKAEEMGRTTISTHTSRVGCDC